MGFTIEAGEFVRILNNGHGHWLTITTIGVENAGEVLVYDSLYRSVNTFIQKHIAAITHTSEREITLKIMDMQIQGGTSVTVGYLV